MEKHFDILDVRATSRQDAQEKVKNFLESYNKKSIRIFKIKRRNCHYQVEVRYYDEYDVSSTFLSKDFKETSSEKTLLLCNKNYQ